VDHIGAVLLHARSLVPLVSARDFGMTPLSDNSITRNIPFPPCVSLGEFNSPESGPNKNDPNHAAVSLPSHPVSFS
jgi:hypothetical protein